MSLVVDGVDGEIVSQWFANVMEADGGNDQFRTIILKVLREGILGIQQGTNPRLLGTMMDSVIPIEYRPKFLFEQKTFEEMWEEQVEATNQ